MCGLHPFPRRSIRWKREWRRSPFSALAGSDRFESRKIREQSHSERLELFAERESVETESVGGEGMDSVAAEIAPSFVLEDGAARRRW